MAYFSKFYNGLRPIIFSCNQLERALALLERRKALAALVLFVGRRYYLRPISAGTPAGLLERA